MSRDMTETIEGRTTLWVPELSLRSTSPGKSPIFFNPAASVNRDISVAVTKVIGGSTFCDSLAGVGARGVRIAVEASESIELTMNDFNPVALKLAKKNARSNSVTDRCNFYGEEANALLSSRFRRSEKFDFVDVDPFGTPARYVISAFVAASDRGIVSLTATDTAVLCGVYPLTSFRRYGSFSMRNDFKHETGLRILLHFCARMAAVNDIGIEPIMAHSTRHYLRLYVRAIRSATQADRSLKNIGYVSNCVYCGESSVSTTPVGTCTACGGRLIGTGPLWTGPLADEDILAQARHVSAERGFVEAARILGSLENVDSFPPYSYSLERVCSLLKIPSVSVDQLMERASSIGIRCMRQPFEKGGIKTDASHRQVVELVRASSGLIS